MSYLVLARKYRPKTFSELVGQEHVVQALANALRSGRLHHAYLFTGTRGVGKTTVSRILAKSLNCRGRDGNGGVTDTPCGVCEPCLDIDRGRFVDYTELDAASNRGVDEVQALLEQAVYKPVQGRFKVFMIDEVHMLTGHAFNAMLKTLEEPPDYLKFVLATTDPQKVPVTVLSRCLQFNLRPMAPQTVLRHLRQVLESEGIAAETAALRLLAKAARGSMRDALSLTDQAIAFGGGELQEPAVRRMLGSVDRSHVLRLIEALATGDARGVIEAVAVLRTHGFSAAATLEDMSALLQRMAVQQAVPTLATAAAEDDDATDDEAGHVARLAALLPSDETQLLYSICLHGRAELGLALDEYAGLTMVLLRLLAFKPATDSAPATQKKTSDETNGEGGSAPAASRPEGQRLTTEASTTPQPMPQPPRSNPAPAVATREPPPAASPVEPPQPLPAALPPPATPMPAADAHGDFWHSVVQQLAASGAIGALVRELALQSQLIERENAHWTLRVESASLDQPTSRERLREALVANGHAVPQLRTEVAAVADSPARRNAAAAERAQREAVARIEGDPFVQRMVREFGARIVPGSVKALAPAHPAPASGGMEQPVVDNPGRTRAQPGIA